MEGVKFTEVILRRALLFGYPKEVFEKLLQAGAPLTKSTQHFTTDAEMRQWVETQYEQRKSFLEKLLEYFEPLFNLLRKLFCFD